MFWLPDESRQSNKPKVLIYKMKLFGEGKYINIQSQVNIVVFI